MSNLKASQLQLAEGLFIYEDKEQEEIATIVGVTPKTICEWKKKYHWVEKKNALTLTRDSLLRSMHNEAAKYIAIMDDPNKKLDSKEADVLSKLSAAIEKLDKKVTIPIVLSVFKEFNSFCSILDKDFTIKMMEFQKKFYSDKKAYGQN